jgi:hypothetical protein
MPADEDAVVKGRISSQPGEEPRFPSHPGRSSVNTVTKLPVVAVGRDSSVGIATRYRLGGRRVESLWERNFPHPSRPALWPTQPPVQWVARPFPAAKAAGAWR